MLFVLILSVLITRQRDYTNGRGLASSQAVAECFCDWCLMLLVFCCWFSLFGPQTPKSNVCLFWSDEVLGRIYIYTEIILKLFYAVVRQLCSCGLCGSWMH